jgi:hypothetical protein
VLAKKASMKNGKARKISVGTPTHLVQPKNSEDVLRRGSFGGK